MRTLILYCSRTGNTHKIVRVMADAIGADMAEAVNASEELLSGRKLVGLASGIYWARHDKSLFAAARKIPNDCRVFLVSTSGFRSALLIKVYTFLMKRKLKHLGLSIAGEWHCPGHDKSDDPLFRCLKLSKGRPNQADLHDAEDFCRKLAHDFT